MSQPFDTQKAREICGRIKGYEDPDGGNCGDFEAAEMFPAALDEIELQVKRIAGLESENERLAKMFADDCYIESAHMEPGYYNINARGKGAMLLAGQLIRFFRESSKGNFITCTFQMGFGDPKTLEQFELTIQKINGEDTPGQKIQRQQEQIEALKDGWKKDRGTIVTLERLAEEYVEPFAPKEVPDFQKNDDLVEARRQLAAEHPDLFREPTEMMADNEKEAHP